MIKRKDSAILKKASTKTITDCEVTTAMSPNKILSKLEEEEVEIDDTMKKLREEIIDRSNKEQWTEILKACCMTNADYLKYTKNRLYSRLIDIIEYTQKVIQDKNIEIRILTEEYKEVNSLNNGLNHFNVALNEQYRKLKISMIKKRSFKLDKEIEINTVIRDLMN